MTEFRADLKVLLNLFITRTGDQQIKDFGSPDPHTTHEKTSSTMMRFGGPSSTCLFDARILCWWRQFINLVHPLSFLDPWKYVCMDKIWTSARKGNIEAGKPTNSVNPMPCDFLISLSKCLPDSDQYYLFPSERRLFSCRAGLICHMPSYFADGNC